MLAVGAGGVLQGSLTEAQNTLGIQNAPLDGLPWFAVDSIHNHVQIHFTAAALKVRLVSERKYFIC